MDQQPPPYNPGYPAQQQQYYQPQGQQMMIAAPMAVSMPMGAFNLRGESVRMTCPFCHAEITTRVRYHTGAMAHFACLVLCIFGFGLCSFVPYCTTCCKDASHECPNCNRFIGTFRRL